MSWGKIEKTRIGDSKKNWRYLVEVDTVMNFGAKSCFISLERSHRVLGLNEMLWEVHAKVNVMEKRER